MAKNSSIVLDIGAKVDKSWQTSLNNIGTDLNKVSRHISKNMQQYNRGAEAIDNYTNRITKLDGEIEGLQTHLAELNKLKLEGGDMSSLLSDKDKRSILKRAKPEDFVNSAEIIKAQQELDRALKNQAAVNTKLGKAEANYATFGPRQKGIAEARNAVNKLKAELQRVNDTVATAKANLNSLFTFENIKQDSPLILDKAFSNLENEIPKTEKKIGSLSNTIDSYKTKIAGLEQSNNTAVANIGQTAKYYIAGLANNAFKKVISSVQKLGKTVISTFGKLVGVFSKTVTQAIGLQKAIRLVVQYGFGFRSLYYLVRRFRTGIEQGFEYLGGAIQSSRKAVSGFSEEVGELLTTLKELVYYLKSAAAAMLQPFMPLINSIIPKLVQWFNALAIAVANFIATLTGQSKIYVASTNLEDYANALDQVAGSANDAKEALGAYDKLNVIHQDKGGGSGANLDTSGWFSEQPVEPSQLAQMIKEAWEKADFTAVGVLIGEKFKSMLQALDWDNVIFPMIERISKSMATLINGFISVEELGTEIGSAVANVLNGVVDYVYTFVRTLKWDDLGKFIVDAINGLLETFDASQFGKAMHDLIDGILTLAGEILGNIKWDKLGSDIADFITNLDLGDIASKLMSVISQFVSGFSTALNNWATKDPESFGLATALATALAAVKLTGIAIPIALQLGTAGILDFSKMDFSKIGELIGQLNPLKGIIDGIGTAISTVSIYLQTSGGLIQAIKGILSEVWTLLTEVWTLLINNPIALIVAAIVAFIATCVQAYQTNEEFRQTVQDLWENIKGLVADIWNLLKPLLNWITGTLVPSIIKAIGWLLDKLTPFVQGVVGVVNSVITILRGIIQFVTGVFTGDWNSAWEGLKTVFSGVWEGLKSIVRGVVNTIIGFINSLISGVNSALSGILGKVNSAGSWISDKVARLTGERIQLNLSVPTISIPKIPTLAQGAVIPPNRQFLAMLGDQTSGTNIEAPLETIKQALVEALGESGNSGAPIVLQLDSRVIAKAVWDENEKRYKQLGKYAY